MPDLQQVAAEIGQHLAEIQALFLPGAKLTLLVRHPSHRDGSRDLVQTNDTLGAAIAALRIRARAQGTARRDERAGEIRAGLAAVDRLVEGSRHPIDLWATYGRDWPSDLRYLLEQLGERPTP